jgi:hypothetical protein
MQTDGLDRWQSTGQILEGPHISPQFRADIELQLQRVRASDETRNTEGGEGAAGGEQGN